MFSSPRFIKSSRSDLGCEDEHLSALPSCWEVGRKVGVLSKNLTGQKHGVHSRGPSQNGGVE